MDFFNEIMKFGDIFESQETIDELKDISDEIKKYDVYDVLARISGLNLMPHNQIKSVLLDSLIAGIICEEENTYNSTYKMSDGKFKKLIGKINETNLALISTQVYHQKLEVISRAELSVERIRSIK